MPEPIEKNDKITPEQPIVDEKIAVSEYIYNHTFTERPIDKYKAYVEN